MDPRQKSPPTSYTNNVNEDGIRVIDEDIGVDYTVSACYRIAHCEMPRHTPRISYRLYADCAHPDVCYGFILSTYDHLADVSL